MASPYEILVQRLRQYGAKNLPPQEFQKLQELGHSIFMGFVHLPLTEDYCLILFAWIECQTQDYQKLVEAATAVINRQVNSPSDKDLVSWVAESIKEVSATRPFQPDEQRIIDAAASLISEPSTAGEVTDRRLEPHEQRIIDVRAFWTPAPSTTGVSTASTPSIYPESVVAALDRLDVTDSHVHNNTPSEHERIGAFMTSRCDIFAVGDKFLLPNKMPALPSPTEFTRDDLPNDVKGLRQAIKNRLDVERDVGEFLIRNRMILCQLKIKEILLRKE